VSVTFGPEDILHYGYAMFHSCQFSPGMGPPVFGHMGPLTEMTLGGFQAKSRLTIGVR
jgi:hypothetical protein